MSRPLGGYIGHRPVPAAAGVSSAAGGMWTLREAQRLKQGGTWPIVPEVVQTIAGLQLWLDAADPTTLYDATTGGSLVAADGGVARWEDKSGNARHATQEAESNRPSRKTAIQAGRDVMRFDGSNDFLEGVVTPGSGNTRSVFVVAKSNLAFAELFQIGKANSGQVIVGFLVRAGQISGTYFFGGDVTANNLTIPSVSLPVSTTFLANIVQQSTTSISYYHNSVNYSVTGTLANFSSPASGYFVGKARANVDLTFWSGDICEIIVYDSALSDTNRGLVESYLMSKWGIT